MTVTAVTDAASSAVVDLGVVDLGVVDHGVVDHGSGACAGGGNAASGTVAGTGRWLGLAATPTFAAMALWTGTASGGAGVLCGGMANPAPLDGMTAMYLLMAAFHLGPWLALISRPGRGG